LSTDRDTPLLLAILKTREDVALELIRLGADVELANLFAHTPLQLASRLNLQATAHALVQKGADINGANMYTLDTPLSDAALYGQVVMVHKLLSWGADPTRMNTEGKTARSWANGEVVKLLDAWGNIKAVWVVRSAGQVRRLSKLSALRLIPKDLCRMVGEMLF
jgi:ankyrin repeat protein